MHLSSSPFFVELILVEMTLAIHHGAKPQIQCLFSWQSLFIILDIKKSNKLLKSMKLTSFSHWK